MNIELNDTTIKLKSNEPVRLRGGTGNGIICLSGSVWITQEHDTRDIILEAGGCFVVDRPGLTLISAIRPGEILIRERGCAARAATASRFRLGAPAPRAT